MFDNLFTTTKAKKKTNNRFEGIFNTSTTAVADKIKISTLPDFLGGGAYNSVVGDSNKLATSTRGYAGVKTEDNKDRHHIIPVEFGGSSETDKNISTLDEKAHKRITDTESTISKQYAEKKITLGQARQQMMTALQKEMDAKQGIKQGTAANFFGGLKDAVVGTVKDIGQGLKDVKNVLKKVTEPLPEDIEKAKQSKTGSIITKQGTILTVNRETGEYSQLDPTGGVGSMKNVAKEGLDAIGRQLLKNIKATNLGEEAKNIVKLFKPAERVVMEDFIDVVNGAKKVTTKEKTLLFQKAQNIAEEFRLPEATTGNQKLANRFAGLFDEQTKEYKQILNEIETPAKDISNPKNFKSAEEYVKAKPVVYHGSSSGQLERFDNKKGGAFFTEEYADATGYAGDPDNVYEGYLHFKKPLVIDAKGAKWDNLNTKFGKTTQEIAGNAEKAGYDGVTFKNIVDNVMDTEGMGESTVHYAVKPEDSFINESQLTDIWNKANKKAISDITNEAGTARLPKVMVNAAESIAPIKQQNEAVKSSFKTWTRELLVGEEQANKQLAKVPKLADNFDTVLKYEQGIKTKYSEVIKKEFDALLEKARANGIDIKAKENYVPQIYDNTLEEVKTAMSKYMKDNGASELDMNRYIAGIEELPDVLSKRLKLNPFFSKERAFPDYKTAIEYGLTPKYTEPAQLLAHYDAELSKTVANRKFLDDLLAKGQVATVEKAGQDWEALTLPFSPKGYYAPPELAKMLNGMFRNEEMLGAIDTGIKGLSNFSKTMQEITLSAGVPKTNINFFALGQLVKNLTAGEYKSAIAFIRSNFNGASIKFLQSNGEYLEKMSNQGIDILKRVDKYDNIYKNLSNTKGIMKKIGLAWDKVFGEKTFKSFMPQMQVQTFKDVYTKALKKMSPEQAEVLAGDTVKAFYGLMENVGRGKGTEDALSATFFAPKFREGIIRTLFNTGKSITTDIFNPAFSKNRKLLAGMILTYAGYNALNKQQSGHYMWDNPDGKEFDLMIPTKLGNTQDDVIYIGFMPSFLAFARNMASGGVALVKGDTDTAKQKLGSLFSMPIKLGSELWANNDYFGREIYKDSDDTKTKALKMAKYAYLSVNHPFIKEITNQITTDKPLYQSISEAMEMPLKFSSYTKIEKQEFYDAIYKQQAEGAKIKDKFKPKYTEVRDLLDAGKIDEARSIVDSLSEEDYKLYKSLKRGDKNRADINQEVKVFNDYKTVQELMATGDNQGAKDIVNNMTDDEYKAYKRLKAKLQ